MSVGLVLGSELAATAGSEAVADADRIRVRAPAESAADRTTGVREMFRAGVDTLLLVDRALPVRSDWARSGVVFALVADHINLTGDNPLVGPNADDWGPRFPDLTDAWDPALRRAVRERAVGSGFALQEGVVGGVVGTARTAAELEMLRMIGADMVSDGFVHEAIVARHAGRRVVGIAVLATGPGLPGEATALEKLLRQALAVLVAPPERAAE